MALGNWSVRTHVSDVDETRKPGEAPADYVVRLAESKARATAQQAPSTTYIVAADTAVVDRQAVIGKPADAADAIQILRSLRGHAHQVYTGLAVLRPADGQSLSDLCVTDVPMRTYSDAEIDVYVRSGDPFDKAGAYAIQHSQFHPVGKLTGCYASVMGLPLCHLLRLLVRMQFASPPDLPTACQAHLNYDCPVSSAILRGEQVG
jgi:septum formation protein